MAKNSTLLFAVLFLALSACFLSPAAFGKATCGDLFSVSSPRVKTAKTPFPHWDYDNLPTEAQLASLILPDDFVRQIKDSGQSFSAWVGRRNSKTKKTIEFAFFADADEAFAQWHLIVDEEHPKTVFIEELQLQNPLKRDQSNLHSTQEKKGLPANVAFTVRNSIFALCRAGGFKYLRTTGAQNYTTLMMYRKFVGFQPADKKSLLMLNYLDQLYARSSLIPEPFTPKSIREFSDLLGSWYQPIVSVSANRAWKKYLVTNDLHPIKGFTVLKWPNGEDMGLTDGRGHFYFANNLDPEAGLLQWSDVGANFHQTNLVLKIPKPN